MGHLQRLNNNYMAKAIKENTTKGKKDWKAQIWADG